MFYLTGYLNHAASVQAAAAGLGIQARMDMADFSLELGEGARRRVWKARFVGSTQGRTAYFDRMGPSTRGFAGWMPYEMRRWQLASDKAAFKQYATERGIATPAACADPSMIGGPFIIKKSRSSFGEGIRGPFLRFDALDVEHTLREGEYYENFILGHIVKAWYWGATWGVVEVRQPPVVTGDGVTPLRDLVRARPDNTRDKPHDWPTLTYLARYCGLRSVDEVPASGQEVLVDFKYGSRFEPTQRGNRNVIDKLRGTPLAEQFDSAGEVFSRGIQEHGDASLFTLDAMIDAQGTVWFLEMNSNPMVHPDMYPLVLRDQFSATRAPLAKAA